LALIISALAACTTATSPTLKGRFALDAALARPPAETQAMASAGQAQAQLAWSIVLHYGLHRVPADPAAAEIWIGKATAERQTTTFPVYTPPMHGRGGSVTFIPLHGAKIDLHEARSVFRCADALDRNANDLPAGSATLR
jgi:hypothetical protein